MKTKRVTYDEIEGSLQTGDLLFCHGIFTEALQVEAMQGSPWSHIGMVVRLPGFEEPLFWESTTTQTLEDVLEHRIKTGPMLVTLKERIATDVSDGYDALFAFRLLKGERNDGMLAKLKAFIEEVHEASFPSLERMAFELLEGRMLRVQAGFKSFFCSELAAETYMRLGIMDRSMPSNGYRPIDLSDRTDLPLTSGYALADELLTLQDA
ncbi:hypothetical protein I8J29_05055 [Paenibacillus sp. MWE-103]|uniref:Permuted papain-like amidase YaeF/Yiix C92 family enzyme n=1 Tax=Paenibacillus artemisiicola TaxID=1172618 RepID=A0ABS3W5F9_9BACL|nr:hypothetical protein [Paenibacillus artemisiicola]MBO7743552.1 hypothetical protein [Paenibacillus artemisiicola]